MGRNLEVGRAASVAVIGHTSARGAREGAREGARPQQLLLLGSPARGHPARGAVVADPPREPGGSSCDAGTRSGRHKQAGTFNERAALAVVLWEQQRERLWQRERQRQHYAALAAPLIQELLLLSAGRASGCRILLSFIHRFLPLHLSTPCSLVVEVHVDEALGVEDPVNPFVDLVAVLVQLARVTS